MNRSALLTTIAGLICLVLGFSACSKGIITPAATRIVLEIETTATVNPDIKGIPSPIVVRFYQLKSTTKFTDSDFISLYEDDKKVLGDDLVQSQEILLSPKDKKYINFEAEENVKAIAGFAVFRQQNSNRWRAVIRILPHKTNTIKTLLVGDTLKMTKQD